MSSSLAWWANTFIFGEFWIAPVIKGSRNENWQGRSHKQWEVHGDYKIIPVVNVTDDRYVHTEVLTYNIEYITEL